MKEKINIKIIGTLTPEVGVAEQYTVKKENEPFEIQPITLGSDWNDSEIEWFVHVRDAGKWRFINDGKKIGKTVDFTFSEISQDWEEIVIIVHAYGGKDIINIKPQPAAKPKITFIELLDVHKNTPKKAFAYGNWIIARVHCVGMELRPIVVTLWEDDGNEKKNIKIELKNRFIERGFVDARFYLNPMHADLANSKADKGESDEGQFHEYYITAEIEGKAKSQISTENTTVANPLYLEKKLAVKNEISIDIQQQAINSLMMVDVSGDDPNGWWTKKEDTCVCKEYDLVWGNKVSCDFRKKVIEISKSLWPDNHKIMANELMTCMALETGEEFKSRTGYPAATGLVQFTEGTNGAITAMNETGYNNGKKITKLYLSKLSEIDQLKYVKLYFEMWMKKYNKKINSALDMYMTIWCPAAVGQDESFVCYSNARDEKYDVKNYDSNKSAESEYYDEHEKNARKRLKKDANKANGEITKGELKPRLKFWSELGKSNKAKLTNCDDVVVPLNAKDIITYHVYANGKIEKHIPKLIKNEFKNYYKYVFHDINNEEHEICVAEWHTTKEKSKGQIFNIKPTHSEILSEDNVSEGNTSIRVKYENGDIAEYGSHPKKGKIWLLYKALKNDIELLRMPNSLNYNKNYVQISYAFSTTERRYTGVNTFAGFIALLATTKQKLITTGSCFSEGSSFPSQKHCNGESIDILYIKEVKKDQLVIDTAQEFHFTEILKGIDDYCDKLKNAGNGGSLHDSHLHIGGFDNSIVKVINEK